MAAPRVQNNSDADTKPKPFKNAFVELGNFLGEAGRNVDQWGRRKMTPPRLPLPGNLKTGNPFDEVGRFVGDVYRNGQNTRVSPPPIFGKVFDALVPPSVRPPRPPNFEEFWRGITGQPDNSIIGGVSDHEREVNSPGGYGQKWTRGFNPAGNQTELGPGEEGPGGPPSFGEILAQVQEMLQGGGGGVSYDPLRAQARSQWSDADARTLAMYQQLQGSIAEEGAKLGGVYDQSVADTNAATQFANTQNAQSAQNVNSMVGQQAGALGIQEAVANDINAGNLSGQDQMARAADTAARGQLTSNQLISGKASGLDFNSDMVGAAGLQGAMDRGRRLNELNRLLAGYDVAEQEANAAAQGSYAQDQMDLAKFLYGEGNEGYQFESNARRDAEKEANDQYNWEREFARKSAGGESGKPPLLTRKQAIDQVLADMGLPSIPGPGDTRNDFFDLVRMYEGR